jgi:hypothetical protein
VAWRRAKPRCERCAPSSKRATVRDAIVSHPICCAHISCGDIFVLFSPCTLAGDVSAAAGPRPPACPLRARSRNSGAVWRRLSVIGGRRA